MPITITTHHEVFLIEHDTIPGMLRETADLIDELQQRGQGAEVEIELEAGLIGCRLAHGIRVFYRAETEEIVEGEEEDDLHPSGRSYPVLVVSPTAEERAETDS